MFSVATGVGGCEWENSSRAVYTDVSFRKLSNNPPKFFVADAMTFFMILHSTCNGLFSGGIAFIGVLNFGPSKNIHLLCFVNIVLRCRLHPNIFGE